MNFIWINRDQTSFEWFVGLLNKIEKEQIDVAFEEGKELEKVIDITLYMTAAKAKTDIRGAGLQMALSIIHRRDKKDLITGLSTRTQAGRPNWNEVNVFYLTMNSISFHDECWCRKNPIIFLKACDCEILAILCYMY